MFFLSNGKTKTSQAYSQRNSLETEDVEDHDAET